MTMDYDLLIIGGGAAGKEAALLAARASLKTLLVEKEKLGGTSYHRGYHVIRALQACAQSFRAIGFTEKDPAKSGVGYGYLARGWSDWSQIRLGVTDRLTKDLRQELGRAQIPVEKGSAKFIDNHTVQVSSAGGKSQKFTADNIIIATGSEPSYPGDGTIFPFLAERKGVKVFNSDQILENSVPPAHLVVLGGGHIGCELASIYRTIGSRVTLIEEKPTILSDWDPLVGQKVLESLTEQGVTVKTGSSFTPEMLPADCDMVLVATGRLGCTKNLDLSQIGVKWGHFIRTTRELRIRGSDFSNIYVIGDANGLLLFDSAAHAQARVAIQNILGNPSTVSLRLIPRSTNTDPPAAFVGPTEAEAKAAGESYEVITEELMSTSAGRENTIEPVQNLVKLLYHSGSRRVLSCLAIGPNSSEIVNQVCFWLCSNMPMESWLNVSAIHPSPSEDLVRALQGRFETQTSFSSEPAFTGALDEVRS
jgi:dihydrolipoamide dehydrogenase